MIASIIALIGSSLVSHSALANDTTDTATIDEVVSIGSKLDQESNRIELDAITVEKPAVIDVATPNAIAAPKISLTPVALVVNTSE